MNCPRVCTVLAATVIAALPGAALAQFPPAPGSSQAPVQDRWPDPPKSPQPGPPGTAPAAPPAAKRAAPAPAPAQAKTSPDGEELLDTPAKKPAAAAGAGAAAPAFAVACSGPFAKDSSHLKLAIKYDSRNITFGEVDGPDGTKIPGSILFPNDPKRRLEVIWAKEGARSETSVIAINGKSQWSAPKGMKLGLPLAALEKANGRPFKLSGFDAEGGAGVAGWEGGALGAIPGGCKMGMRFAADPKVPKEARAAIAGDKEILSNDASVRALKPMVVEILIGY